MRDLLAFLTLRTFLIFGSTAFSLLFIMLALNIITVDDAVKILHMSPEAATAFKTVVSRVQEVTGNILDIISQLLNKLLGWAGVDVDLNKIKVDTNQINQAAEAASDAANSSATSATPDTNKK